MQAAKEIAASELSIAMLQTWPCKHATGCGFIKHISDNLFIKEWYQRFYVFFI